MQLLDVEFNTKFNELINNVNELISLRQEKVNQINATSIEVAQNIETLKNTSLAELDKKKTEIMNSTDLKNYYLTSKGEELNKRIYSLENYTNNLNDNKLSNDNFKNEISAYIKKENLNIKASFHHASSLGLMPESTIVNTDLNSLWLICYYPIDNNKILSVESSTNQDLYWLVASGCTGIKSVVLSYGQSVRTKYPQDVKEIEIFKVKLGV